MALCPRGMYGQDSIRIFKPIYIESSHPISESGHLCLPDIVFQPGILQYRLMWPVVVRIVVLG